MVVGEVARALAEAGGLVLVDDPVPQGVAEVGQAILQVVGEVELLGETIDDAAGEAFNIGAGGREYLIDVYHDLCKALGKDVEPNFGPNRAGDIRDSNADITKARELLGYDPEYDFAKGINLAIDWYKENL